MRNGMRNGMRNVAKRASIHKSAKNKCEKSVCPQRGPQREKKASAKGKSVCPQGVPPPILGKRLDDTAAAECRQRSH